MKRPTSVTVIAVINIIIGALGILGGILALVKRFIPAASAATSDASSYEQIMQQIMDANPGFQLFTDVSTMLGIIVSVLMLIAAIALFSLHNWARLVTVAIAFYSLLISAIAIPLNYVIVTKPMLEQISPQFKAFVTILNMAGFVFAAVFLLYYLLTIILMCRPKTVAAFTTDPDQDLLNEFNINDSAPTPERQLP